MLLNFSRWTFKNLLHNYSLRNKNYTISQVQHGKYILHPQTKTQQHNMCHLNVPHQVRAQRSYLNVFPSSPLLSAELHYSSNATENQVRHSQQNQMASHPPEHVYNKTLIFLPSKNGLQTPVEWPRHPLACHHGVQ